MSDPKDALRAAFDQAVVTITKLKSTVAALERSRAEPIAIVAMGCRYPGGVTDPESFWRLLDEGIDAITPVPTDRWDMDALYGADGDAGKVTTRSGGFLPEVDRFDAAFFGISPREAMSLDPQQRLLLETSWEALERAGIAAERLAGSSTGVFVGLSSQEYGSLVATSLDQLDGYATTGSASSVASGRISYVLGLHGPSMTVDTGCSSSLVTVHLACQALRQRECSLALAGGVTVMLTPGLFVEFSRLRGLAADGRCKSFSAAADGFGPSEGCAMLVLERLSDARRNGHPVLAIIRGSAVNQDGRSNGLTAPNGPAQEACIRRALEQAKVNPADVQYLECHGTGTMIGDPIEVQALGGVFTEGRDPGRPLVIGSVKSNLGHPQAAGGAAGIIKVVLSLLHDRIPKSLHFDVPSPHIPWADLPVKVAAEAREWPRNGAPRIAGVSAFGVSGTNAHLVIEDAPADEAPPVTAPPERPELVLVSAKSPEALREAAARLRAHVLAHPEHSLRDTAFSLATARTHHEHRLSLVASSRDELVVALDAAARGETAEGASIGHVGAGRPKVVFVFPGQGSQWIGMGRELLAAEPVFREALEACDRAIRAETGWSLIAELQAPPETSRLASIDVVQPALFAMGVALAALWRSYGVEPDAVVGHSMGEVAAAYVAGALSLEDAVVVICRRSRLLLRICGQGEMAMVQLPVAEAQAAIAGHESQLSVAVSNSRRSTVLSGTPSAIEAVLAKLEARGVYCKRVKVDVASHSPQVDPLRDELVAALASLSPRAPSIKMRSTVTAAAVGDAELTAAYWANNLRAPVRLADVVEALATEGHGVFVEMSPHPVLLPAIEELRTDSQVDGTVSGSLHRDRPERAAFLASLGKVHGAGCRVDLGKVFPDGGRRVPLPTYPWQRERYWVKTSGGSSAGGRTESLEAELRRLGEQTELSPVEREAVPKLIAMLETQRVDAQVDDWFHAIEWRPHALAQQPERPRGRWLVLDDGAGIASSVTSAMARAGWSFDVVPLAKGAEGLRAAAIAGSLPVEGVIAAGNARPDGEHAVLACARFLAIFGAEPPRCWLVTRGAVTTGRDDPVIDPDQGLIWGFGRTFALEHPRAWGGLVDLPADGETIEPATADALLSLIAGKRGEDQIAIRKGGAFVARLVRRALRAKRGAQWSTSGTALVTGALGGVGLHVARWLAERGVKHLLLTSRRGMDTPGAAAAVDELQKLGAEVVVARADVADRQAMEAAALALASPVTAIFHAAGVADSMPLHEIDAAHYATALSAKHAGTRVLEALSRGWSLDAFVCFSSGAGVWGAGGLGAYGAANAFLDAWAQCARAAGCPATSVSWGLWAGEGMGNDDQAQSYLKRRGVRPMAPALALMAMERALVNGHAHAVVADIEWSAFRKGLEAWGARPLLAEIGLGREEAAAPGQNEPKGAWARELAELSPRRRVAAVVEAVQAHVARVLLLANASAVSPDRPLRELGLDSLMAVELRNGLARRVGTSLPATLAFDYPTPTAIAKYLVDCVFGAADAPNAAASPRVAADEPIAIVGIGCRYPGGVEDPESFWRLLDTGIDAVGEIPPGRWDVDALYDPDPAAPGKMITRCGGFLSEIERFDPGFFGISPREAVSLDPQQRLLLETSWEALERAGIPSDRLLGSSTGVFVGLGYHEYGNLVTGSALERLDGYVGTGNMASAASGRISYVLGLNGPSMTVDTACSSSLVTVHLACQSLRQGECSLALAGGVAVMLTPAVFVEFSRLRALSVDGRCKSFSAAASGTGWAEGCGMIALERLSDAQRNGHPVLAVIRGSAINQDGRSNGLTAPNGPSQEAVIRLALEQARVRPAEVQYVECHGTGTTLGDPIEVQALGAAYGRGRDPARPMMIGSVKSNLGHPQAAGGIAGLIKTVLALGHARIPKNLHFDAPSPHIPWDELAVKVVAEPVEWPEGDEPRIAGVSAFGASGTNAHVIVAEAPKHERGAATHPARSAQLVVVSAKSAEALDEVVVRLQAHAAAHPDHSLEDLAMNLATTRTHHEHRLALSVRTREGLVAALDGRGRPGEGAALGAAGGKVAWLFTGQGSQHVGMGRELSQEWPVFRDALDAACKALDPHLELPLRDVMWAEPGTEPASLLDATSYTQPALFALQWALAALWRSWGVEPAVLAGHSIGELSAACVAGLFSLEDGARLVAARGRLMQALEPRGAMLSIAATEADVRAAIAAHVASVSIAAVNGPESVVVSGAESTVIAIGEAFAAKGVRTKRLVVSHAFHSPLMVPMLDELRRVAESVIYRRAEWPVVSNLTGALGALAGEHATAEYWVRHAREAVRFGQGVETLHAAGVTQYLELGPKPTLLGLVPLCLPDVEPTALLLASSLRPERGETEAALEALGSYYVHGGRVEWSGVFADGGRRIELPTYPWQRQRYWAEAAAAQAKSGERTDHPLLGVRVSMAGPNVVYESAQTRAAEPWLYEHRVGDHSIVPGAGLAELMRAAAEHQYEGEPAEVVSLVLQTPLVLSERGAHRVQVVLTEGDESSSARMEASVYSQPADARDGAAWVLHASAEVHRRTSPAPAALDLAAIRRRCPEILDAEGAYEKFVSVGLGYGPAFQGMRRLARGKGEALAEASLPESIPEAERYGVHPALLDAAFHAIHATLTERNLQGLYLPFTVDRLTVHRAGARSAIVHVRLRDEVSSGETFAVDVTLTDPEGNVLVDVAGFRCRPVDTDAIASAEAESPSKSLYCVEWQPAPVSPNADLPPGRWVVVAPAGDRSAEDLVARLRMAGATCIQSDVMRFGDALPAENVVCLWTGVEAADRAGSALRLASEALSVAQASAKQPQAPRLWWVTRGAAAVATGDAVVVEGAALWGLGRTVMQEIPELECSLIDLPAEGDVAELVMRELATDDDERQVAWREGRRSVARLGRASPKGARREMRPGGTVLITGGLGALGLHVARWLAARGVPHLVLTGRRGAATPGAAAAVAELEALGARVTVAAVDVADRPALARVLDAIGPETEHPLRGVVHAAGVLDDGVLSEQSPERFAGVMTPKVAGACHLDELTRDADLDFFVLFSSATGTLGSGGQGAYAAANACLDALAGQRRARGLRGQSLAWGLWTDASARTTGLAASLDAVQQARLARSGLAAVTPSQGIGLLEAVLGRDEAQLLPLPIQLGALRKAFGDAVPPFWRGLVRTSRRAIERGAWIRELRALPASRRLEAVIEGVRAEVARALSFSGAAAVGAEQSLRELGLDSLTAVELRNSLSRLAGSKLPATLAFDHPTAAAIARHLVENVLSFEEPAPRAAAAAPADAVAGASDPRRLVHAHLEEAAIEVRTLLRGGAVGAHGHELDAAAHAAIDELSELVTTRLAAIEQRRASAPVCVRAARPPRARVFCFPHAGGSAESFHVWRPVLPDDIELYSFPYPRSGPSEPRAFVDTAVGHMLRHLDLPYAIVGHSMGAAIAWRLTMALVGRGAPLPKMLVVSGCPAPSAYQAYIDRIAHLSSEELLSMLSTNNMRPGDIPRDAIEAFERDVRLVVEPPAAPIRLPVPVLALIGSTDALVRRDDLEGWRDVTTASTTIETIPGSHHYWFDAASCRQLVARVTGFE